MNKNLPKFVKHIFPSNKQRTGVWFAGYRDLHLPFISTDVVNAVDLVKTISINMPVYAAFEK
jgi:hypothetical protein